MNQDYLKKWLIVQIKPNSYDLASRNLQRQGFETFLPKMKITIKKENKFINRYVAVFPGYMFVGIDLQNSDWNKINSTFGVSKLLVFNQKPSVIPNDFILALKSRYKENIAPIKEEKLKQGDVIKFENGPFVDFIARIERVDEKNRIWFFLEIMGQFSKVKIKKSGKVNFTKF
mgnify:CR=1 FL=1